MGVVEDAAKAEADRNAVAKAEADLRAAKDARSKTRKPFVIHGRPGMPFNIDGEDFGVEGGEITINDRHVATTRWNDKSIKGQLPADLKPGKVVIKLAGGDVITGDYVPGQPLGNPPNVQSVNVPEGPVKAKA